MLKDHILKFLNFSILPTKEVSCGETNFYFSNYNPSFDCKSVNYSMTKNYGITIVPRYI